MHIYAGMIMFSKRTCEHMIMYQHVTTLVTCMYVSIHIHADMYHTGNYTQVNLSTCMWFVSELNACKHTNLQTCDHTQNCTCGNMHISTVWCLLEVTYLSTHAYVPACAHSQNFICMLKCAYVPTYDHTWNCHVCQHAHMYQYDQDQNFHRYQNAHTWWCVTMLRVACM